MTTGINIPINASGGASAEAELGKVTNGLMRVKKAATDAAGAAGHMHKKLSGHGDHGEHPDHGGHGAGYNALQFGGSILGGIARRLAGGARAGSRLGADGVKLGVGAFLAVEAGRKMFEALEQYSEHMVKVVEITEEIEKKVKAAAKQSGIAGMSYAGSANGMATNRLLAQGVTEEQIKDAQRKGVDAETLAKVGVDGVDSMGAARRFGLSTSQAASIWQRRGGMKGDAFANARSMASEAFNTNLTDADEARARAGGHFQTGMDTIAQFGARAEGAGAEAVSNGKGSAAAISAFNKASSPEMSALSDAYAEGLEKSEIMQRIADTQTGIQKFLQVMSGQQTLQTQANMYRVESSKGINAVHIAAGGHE